MADKITNDITLLFKTKLDEKSKQEVGKNLKSLLENAAIGFDEAETKRNLEPIIRMMKKLFDKAEIAFDADQLLAMPSRQALQKMAEMEVDQLQTAFDKALAKSGGIKIDFGNMDLSAMTEPLEKLTQELSEIGERVASTTKKSVREIENSLKSLSKTKDFDKTMAGIEKTLGVVDNPKHYTSAKKATAQLESARVAYAKSVTDNDPWEIQYQHLLTFVTRYEAMIKKIKPVVDTNNPEFKQLYEMLSPKAGAAKISLEHFVDIAQGNELREYKNQPWARESTLKKIEQTLSSGITVKDGPNGNSGNNDSTPPRDVDDDSGKENKSPRTKALIVEAPKADTDKQARIEAEKKARAEKAAAEAAEKRRKAEEKITKAIKERQPYEAYRSIESPKNSGKSKKDAISDFGAEVWATNIDSAASYAEDHRGASSILRAKIRPVNPLIFDAEDNFWSDFDKIPGLAEFFPGLLEYAKNHISDDTQKWMHEKAKELGFDSVIFENVRDDLDADINGNADTTTTIAVLSDAIVSLEGAFKQLKTPSKDGTKRFSSSLLDVPKYYVPPENVPKDQYLKELQDRQVKISSAYENVISSFNATLDEQKQKLQNAEQELASNPQSSLAKGHVKDAKEEIKNTEQIISKFQQQMQYNQRALQIEIDDYARALGKNIDIESEKVDVVSDIQKETITHEENTAAIVAETKAVEQLNEEKVESQQINAKEDVAATVEKPAIVVEPVGEVEAKDSIQTEELRQLLSAITYNVKVIQDAEPAEDNKISIDEAALESVLNRITYNVKIAHDDADKTANKIAIDEGALESTLKRVFTNVLNPAVEQPETEPKNEPWALEKTLLSVKEVLDGIRTNTAKTDLVEVAPASTEVGNVLATENTLVAIKTAVEAINKKVVKGTKAKTSEGSGKKKTGVGKKNAESYDGSRYFPEKLKTQTMQLAKFRAQLMTTGKLTDDVDAQIYELLDGLAQVKNGPDFSAWSQKFQQLKTSVGITDIFDKADDKEVVASYQQLIEFQKTRNKLELQYEKAQDGSALKQFYAEQLAQMDSVIAKQEEMLENEEYELKLAKMQEEQARKLGEVEAKAADKDVKKRATAAKKLAQREAMLGKTGSAVGRAESTWVNAVGLEGDLPTSFTTEIDEYYQKLDALRKKHQELKNSDIISEEQKKELIAQTMEINKMTSEISELVSEYQKLSGDNTSVIGTNVLSADAGIGAYEQQLKQAVATATNGKAQIKNFDAATKTLTYTVKTGKNEFTEYTAAIRRLDGQLVSVQGTTKRTETFFEATKRKMKELTSYFSGMAVFNQIGQELRRGIQYVREIDLALTELKKVTDETEESYDKFLDTAAKTGARLGTTISAVTEATATFAKLGYSMEQATEMAEAAIVYKNVGDNIASTEDAADSIISTMKGFRLEATESMAIVDRFNEVGNRFAITSQGIGEALRLSASALSEGGNSLDESIALITAANEVVNDPSSVGTALKTLTLRLRGSKTELEEMGEDVSDMATTTSALQAKLLALTSGKVDIMLDANTFKNSTQILREMADAWEDMNDIQRASALELMGGKRQANVLSALIQNFDTVESVIETSADSAGSALKENERYLDSIQGKIDQFNNAMQAMWSNTLDSDVVKGFVSLGTEIIKIIDKIGLLNTALITLATYSMIKNKMGPIAFFGGISDIIRDVVSKVGGFIGSLTGMTVATSAYTAETLAASVANGTLSASEAASIATKNGLALATTNLTAAEASEMLMKAGVTKADALSMVAKLGLTSSTQALSLADIQAAVSSGVLTTAQGAQIASALGLTVANKGLTASLMALWTALWPILAVMAGVAVIWGVVKGIDALIKTTEELQEELDGMKSELSDIRSELDSVNSELETTNKRMAELLAKDKLTFEEQEELDKLRATNDELERRKELLEDEDEIKSEQVGRKAAEVVNKTRSETLDDGWRFSIYSAEEDILNKIDKYKETKSKLDNASSLKEQEKYKKKLDKQSDVINEYILGLSDALEGVEYGDSEESDEALDYLSELQDTYGIARGSANAKTNAIKGLFNKDEFSETKTAIDGYVDALAKGDTNAANSIARIIKSNKDLVQDLEARGLEAQDAIDYFTKLGSEANYATLDGKIAEVSKAAPKFESLLKGDSFKVDGVDTGLVDLFDEEGKVVQTKLSQVFQDTSDQTREDITNLLEGSYNQIKNGTVDTEKLLTGFALKTTQQVLQIQNKVLGEQNLELFPNLKDEIDGIIDKFSEFSAAVGSVVDALDTLEQARAEEAYSGSISIETLENLMKYTDDYTQLVEIDETGAIRLATNAEQILVEQRIEKIKTDAAAAVQTAQTNLEQAKYNAKAVNETGPVQRALTAATDGLAGAWAYLGSLIGDITDGNFSGIFERAKSAYNSVTADREEKRTQVNVSVEDAEEALANALNQQKIANALTSDNIKSKYSSEEASGGNKTKDEVEDDRFQRAMDYWKNRIGANQARYEQLQNEIDLLESKGQKADESYYEEQIKLEQQRLSLLQKQKAEAQSFLGTFAEGSDEWWEVANTLNDIEGELDSVTSSILDLQDAIAEIDTYKFEEFNTRLDNLVSKLETIGDLIAPNGEEDWFSNDGSWTEAGVAVLGKTVQTLELYKQGLEETEAELNKYNKAYSDNTKAYYEGLGIHSEQEYYDKVEELTSQQYDFAESISDTEQSIVDMYESSIDAIDEYIQTLIDGYSDYISSVKEALDSEKELFEFKKNVQKQSKDIAELERRIASLSGSTNKSEIAERRKLEAQLYESRESLNDTYYDHAKDAQNNALDAEQSAYEETMNKFIEGMRTSLETATQDMDAFLGNVTTMVSLNAGAILEQYQQTQLPLDDALTNPWEAAKEAVGNYSGDALELMNTWAQNGFLTDFPNTVKTSLESPWKAGQTAVDAFKISVDTQMKNVVSTIETNVKTASGKLSELYKQIIDTNEQAANVGGGGEDNYIPGAVVGAGAGAYTATQPKVAEKTKVATPIRPASPERSAFKKITLQNTGVNIGSKTYSTSDFKRLQVEGKDGIYFPYTAYGRKNTYVKKGEGYSVTRDGAKYKIDFHSFKPIYTKHAKGTTGTPRDEWAITDEFGPELKMYATPEGNLSFMALGSTVVPHDLTMDLIELPSVVDGLINRPNFDSGINMISNAINKPEIKLDIENFLNVGRVDQDTLPALEKMMDKKINEFSRQLNYALKGKGAR